MVLILLFQFYIGFDLVDLSVILQTNIMDFRVCIRLYLAIWSKYHLDIDFRRLLFRNFLNALFGRRHDVTSNNARLEQSILRLIHTLLNLVKGCICIILNDSSLHVFLLLRRRLFTGINYYSNDLTVTVVDRFARLVDSFFCILIISLIKWYSLLFRVNLVIFQLIFDNLSLRLMVRVYIAAQLVDWTYVLLDACGPRLKLLISLDNSTWLFLVLLCLHLGVKGGRFN